MPMLFFFGLSVWCVLGLPGLAGCLSVGPLSGLVVDSGDTRIGVGCGFRWGGGALGGVVARVLFLVRVNEVAHLGRKNLVSSSCGLGCCGWGEGFAVFFVAWGVLGEGAGDLD